MAGGTGEETGESATVTVQPHESGQSWWHVPCTMRSAVGAAVGSVIDDVFGDMG